MLPRTASGTEQAKSAPRRSHVGCVNQAYAAVSAISAKIERIPEHGAATSTEKGCAPCEITAVPCRTTSRPKPRSTKSAVPLATRRRWIVTASRNVESGTVKRRKSAGNTKSRAQRPP